MKRLGLGLGLGLGLVVVVVVGGCKGAHRGRPDGGYDGRKSFVENCGGCHGVGGRGDTPQGKLLGAKDLTRDEVRRVPDLQIAHQIRVGAGRMPGFGGVLDDDEVTALVAYVRSLAQPRSP